MKFLLKASTSLVLVPLLCACEIRLSEEEVQARIDPQSDSLDVLFVYLGVSSQGKDENSVKKALEVARQFQAGRQSFLLLGWPLALDLDDLAANLSRPRDEKASGKERTADPEFRKRALEVIRGSIMRERGSFLDEGKRLCAYQLFYVEKLSRAIAVVNEAISRSILDSVDRGESPPNEKEFDDRTRELWKARAQSGGPWISLDGVEIVIDLPMTLASFDRLREAGLEETRKKILKTGDELEERDGLEALAQLLLHVRRFDVSDDRILLRLRPTLDGLFRFFVRCDREPYDPSLLEAVRKEGIVPDPKLTLEEVRGKLGKGAPKPEEGPGKKGEPGAKGGGSS
jgi:hypothetical protein